MQLLSLTSLLALVLVLNAPAIKEDLCTAISKKQIFTFEEALVCLRNIDLDPKRAEEDTDFLKKVASFYVYLNIAKNSPEKKVPGNVNLIKGLDKIKRKKHKKEIPLYLDIIRLSDCLHGGDNAYDPACVSYFLFRQQFPLYTYHDENGNQIVKVLSNVKFPPAYQEYWLSKAVDVSKYLGKKVHLISGQSPFDYIQMRSDKTIVVSRDAN